MQDLTNPGQINLLYVYIYPSIRMHEYFPTHMIMENLNAYNKRFVVIFFRIYIFKIQTIKRPRPFEKKHTAGDITC